MQKTRDHPNSRSGSVKEDVLKAISGFFIILAFIAVISLFSGMGGSSGGTTSNGSNDFNDGSSDSKIIFVVNDFFLEAPKDTTWKEFVSNKTLNKVGFTIVDDNVYLGDSKVIEKATNLPVTSDMYIVSDALYINELFSGENTNPEDPETPEDPDPEDPDTPEDPDPEMISFTVGTTSLQAPSGMTWEEWCESDYSPVDFVIAQSVVFITGSPSDMAVHTSDGVLVLPSDIIIEGHAYKNISKTTDPEDPETPEDPDPEDPETPEDPDPEMISFTVGITSLQAPSGMTWEEWCESDYSPVDFVIEQSVVFITGSPIDMAVHTSDGVLVLPSDIIIEGHAYVNISKTTEPTLISFTIDATSYTAEEGMTWADWCASEYNTDGWYEHPMTCTPSDGYVAVTFVTMEDEIIADTGYFTASLPEGIG